jgi:hypothetical protein
LRDQLSEPCFNSNINSPVAGCGTNVAGSSTPLITKFAPAKVATGSTTQITLTGSNFINTPTPPTISVDNGDTVSGVSWISPTEVRFTFVASPSAAALGTRVLTLTNADGGVAKGTFEIVSSTITITGVSPNPVPNGANTQLTLTGTGFATGATVTFDAGAGTGGAVTPVNATSLKVQLAAKSGPGAAGAHTVTVTNPDGASATGTFSIGQPSGAVAMTFTGIAPGSVTAGTPTTMTLTGTNFAAGVSVSVGAGGGTIGSVTRNSATSLTVAYTPATAGTHTFIVKNPDGGTASRTFTVTAKVVSTPVITNVTSPKNKNKDSYEVTGTGFISGAVVSISGIGTIETTFVNSTKLTFGKGATWVPKGSYDVTVTVTNPDGGKDSYDATITVK